MLLAHKSSFFKNQISVLGKSFNINKFLMMVLSLIAGITLIFSTMPVTNIFKSTLPIYLLLYFMLYLLVSNARNVLNNTINHIYIFFNIFVYFFLFSMEISEKSGNALNYLLTSDPQILVSLLLLTLFAIIFVLMEGSNKEKSKFFLPIDLYLALFLPVAVIAAFVNNSFDYSVITTTIILSYVMYTWYRIFVSLFEKHFAHFFLCSFCFSIIPLVAIIIL